MANKKLTAATITKLNNKLNEQKVIRVCGGEYEVNIDLQFRRSKMQKLILSYFTILQDLKSKNNVTDETIMQTAGLLNALIAKYFSDCPLPEINNIEKLIQSSEALLDLGIMEELFGENGFPKSEIEKLTVEIDKASKSIGTIMGELAVKQALENVGEEDGNV